MLLNILVSCVMAVNIIFFKSLNYCFIIFQDEHILEHDIQWVIRVQTNIILFLKWERCTIYLFMKI